MKLRFVIVLGSLAAAGCAVQRTTPTAIPTARSVATAEPAQAPALSALPPAATAAETPDTTPALTPPSNQTPPAASARELLPTSEKVAAAPAGPAAEPGIGAAPDSPEASPPSADTLDFAALGARLRTTKAIGVLTKLSVKSQADDLLEQFRDYYARRSTATLPDLRRSYDMLVVKLLSLLQDGDPPLATDIDRSRAAIWDILSDQRKFIDSHLMARASP